jgi:hypothetical protein
MVAKGWKPGGFDKKRVGGLADFFNNEASSEGAAGIMTSENNR